MSILQELLLTGESVTLTIETPCRKCGGKGYWHAVSGMGPFTCSGCHGHRVLKSQIPLKEFVDFIRNT